jgi:transcriptional regulator with XRE-family HTH domain
MSISERIDFLMRDNNMSPSAFADRVGVQRSNISHIMSGRNKPGLDILEKIVTSFPALNASWLLTGKGEPYAISTETKSVHLERIVHYYTDGTFEIFVSRTK